MVFFDLAPLSKKYIYYEVWAEEDPDDNPYPVENLLILLSFFTIFFFRRVYGIKTIKFDKNFKLDKKQLFAAAGGQDILKPQDIEFDNLEFLDAEETKQKEAQDIVEKKIGSRKGRF